MINVSLGRAGGARDALVAVSEWRVVEVVVPGVVTGEMVTVVVLEEVVVGASAAGEVEETAEVAGDAGEPVVTMGTSVLVTEGSPLTSPACSTSAAEVIPVFPERSVEAADEPHATAAITANSPSTAICGLFTRLTLRLRQWVSPLPRKGPA